MTMNRRELLLSAAAGTALAVTPRALATAQKFPDYGIPGVYVQELPGPQAIIGLPTAVALFIGPLSSTLPTGETATCYRRDLAPAGFDLALPLIEQFFDQGGTDLVLMQAAAPQKGLPDYAGALAALDRSGVSQFNLLLLTGAGTLLAADPAALGALYRSAAATARTYFAQLLIEAPDAAPDYAAWRASLSLNDPDMAAWAPWLTAPDGSLIPPGAAMAGLIARTDAASGVWQAPAGTSATLDGFTSRAIAADQLQAMNTAHINAIRPLQGSATAWGARTLSDNPEWLYLPVRRLLRWTEASIAQGIGQYVFQPNTRPTWDAITRDVEAFLADLWRQGALSGAIQREAFFVNCGLGETMTAQDIFEDRLIIQIGLAAVRPAEFITINLELRLAG
tara:strand:+ start:697 stop:1878 length:1182 start_codon:yes stop_codon:yes gene_type:complete